MKSTSNRLPTRAMANATAGTRTLFAAQDPPSGKTRRVQVASVTRRKVWGLTPGVVLLLVGSVESTSISFETRPPVKSSRPRRGDESVALASAFPLTSPATHPMSRALRALAVAGRPEYTGAMKAKSAAHCPPPNAAPAMTASCPVSRALSRAWAKNE